MRAMQLNACIAAACLSACAGDGTGLDESGRPAQGGVQTLQPTLASIQQHVFTPICATCHAGAAAPVGLRLDEGSSFAMLVNAPSVEQPALLRVKPGDPDNSYLVHKIEGRAAVGARMPLNGPALPAETISIIRQWIANGAQAQSATTPAQLDAIWPPPDAMLVQAPHEIILSASAELDASLFQAGVVQLLASGGDGDFSDGDELAVPVRIDVRSLEPTVLTVTSERAWIDDHYLLRASGRAPLALADRDAQPIDGDRDGASGGDFEVRFTVESDK